MRPHALSSSSPTLRSQPLWSRPKGEMPPPNRAETGRDPRADQGSTRISRLPPLVGIARYLAHGLVFLLLAIVTLACFGQLFWFFSSVNVVLALYSIYKASAGLHAYWRLSRRNS